MPETKKLFKKYQLAGRGGADPRKKRREKICRQGSERILIRRKSRRNRRSRLQGGGNLWHASAESNLEQPGTWGLKRGCESGAKGRGAFLVGLVPWTLAQPCLLVA